MIPRRSSLVVIAAASLVIAATLIWLLATPPPQPASAPGTAPSTSAGAATTPGAAATAPGAPGAAVTPEVTAVVGDDTFRLYVFSVPLSGARLRVLDLAMSRDLAGALKQSQASLVVNGGFFDRSEKAEGLVISEGVEIAARSDTLGGGVLAISGGRAALFAAEGYKPAPGVTFAIQARPRLVVDDKSVIARDDGKAAERTALCARAGGQLLEVVIARGDKPGVGPTLALFADMLVSRGCQAALNLDGGPSTGIAWRGEDAPQELPPRGPVRHGVAIWATEE